MPDLNHLSYSSISTYLLCGNAWRLRYLERVAAPVSVALPMGSAFHGVIESYIKAETEPDDTQLLDIAATSWREQMERDNDIDWGDDTPEQAANTLQRMVKAAPVRDLFRTLRANYDPNNPVCAIEKRVELKVPGVPIPVIGYIDFIGNDGIPGDFKTAARMWTSNKADGELQPLFYLAALNQAGQEVPGWRFRHHVVTKTQRPDAKTFEVAHKPSEMFWLFELITAAWRGIEAGVFPLNPSTWKCGPKYCEYFGQCRGKYS